MRCPNGRQAAGFTVLVATGVQAIQSLNSTSQIEDRLRDLGYSLPQAAAAVANYVPFVISGSLLHIAGQLSFTSNLRITGTVGKDVTPENARHGAAICALNLLAQALAACDGDLGRVSRLVKLGVFVQAADGFSEIPAVANGASDLMVAALGEAGKHARSAVGVYRLPLNAAVEIDALFEIRP